ncbi:MAB_1171c family putative transporter [Streptomyces sp. PU_AKi4]|uniref:MAB_1171c family putative transporter n=1 Tax=Streptomyces sp. PU_AKi4 TaxID=2800809 RepID=UPI0035266A52
MIILQVLTGLLLDLSLVWKIYKLCKAPHDRPLRAVTLCMASAVGFFSLGIPGLAKRVTAVAGAGTETLLQNALLLCTAYWLLCFYVYSTAESHRAARRVRMAAVPLAAALLVAALATATAPGDTLGGGYAAADMTVPQVAVFYVSVGSYLVCALATASYWTLRYAMMSPRPLATGLWLAFSGLSGMAVASAGRVAFTLVRWRDGRVPEAASGIVSWLLAVSVPLFVVGVMCSAVAMRLAASRVWWQHLRTYRRLGPLWQLLHEAYPQDALARGSRTRWHDVPTFQGVHRRYYRRVIECRDGLVRASPALAGLGVGPGAPPDVLAERLRAALRADTVDQPGTHPAIPIALPEEDGLDADARQLVALSDALRS